MSPNGTYRYRSRTGGGFELGAGQWLPPLLEALEPFEAKKQRSLFEGIKTLAAITPWAQHLPEETKKNIYSAAMTYAPGLLEGLLFPSRKRTGLLIPPPMREVETPQPSKFVPRYETSLLPQPSKLEPPHYEPSRYEPYTPSFEERVAEFRERFPSRLPREIRELAETERGYGQLPQQLREMAGWTSMAPIEALQPSIPQTREIGTMEVPQPPLKRREPVWLPTAPTITPLTPEDIRAAKEEIDRMFPDATPQQKADLLAHRTGYEAALLQREAAEERKRQVEVTEKATKEEREWRRVFLEEQEERRRGEAERRHVESRERIQASIDRHKDSLRLQMMFLDLRISSAKDSQTAKAWSEARRAFEKDQARVIKEIESYNKTHYGAEKEISQHPNYVENIDDWLSTKSGERFRARLESLGEEVPEFKLSFGSAEKALESFAPTTPSPTLPPTPPTPTPIAPTAPTAPTAPLAQQKDQFGFVVGERKQSPEDGKWYEYIGNNNWKASPPLPAPPLPPKGGGGALPPSVVAPPPTKFDPEGTEYDYETARKYGIKPDATGHWPSREPTTGQILKGRKHKTFNLTEIAESEAGMEIYKGKDGKYYSRAKKPLESIPSPPTIPSPLRPPPPGVERRIVPKELIPTEKKPPISKTPTTKKPIGKAKKYRTLTREEAFDITDEIVSKKAKGASPESIIRDLEKRNINPADFMGYIKHKSRS